MKTVCEANGCTGCMACYAACRFDAIEIQTDELGVLHPCIREDICRNCGACTAVCPSNRPIVTNTPMKAYAMYAADPNDRIKSASGGVASVLYRSVLQGGGAVFGVGYDENAMPILKSADSLTQAEEFAGSKYVYAYPGRIYTEVKERLEKGTKCLFIGTPCQIAGLKGYLSQKEYSNLITIDIICHGVPPFRYLEEYVHTVNRKKKAVKKVTFRGERNGYLTVWKNDTSYIFSRKQEEDIYYHSFLRSLIHRHACYSCQYANAHRVSDITIGDFWGLDAKALDGYPGGKSVVLIHTERGDAFMESHLPCFVYEERPVAEAIAGNARLRGPAVPHKDREAFCKVYSESQDFMKAIRVTSIPKETRKYRIRNKVLKLPRRVRDAIKHEKR